jgi:hypothetical protein
VKYREIEFTVLRSIPEGWRWAVKTDLAERAGTCANRETAIVLAKRSIDHLIKARRKLAKLRQNRR